MIVKLGAVACALALMLPGLCGCGLVFQAGTRYREHRMLSELHQGQTMTEIRQGWGEPDLIENRAPNIQVWSYAARPNSNDPLAFTVYTSAKSGDSGTFLDLTMVDGRLSVWAEGQHTIPTKESSGVGLSIGGPASQGPSHY